jgi:hypothetical protein
LDATQNVRRNQSGKIMMQSRGDARLAEQHTNFNVPALAGFREIR